MSAPDGHEGLPVLRAEAGPGFSPRFEEMNRARVPTGGKHMAEGARLPGSAIMSVR